MSKYYWELTERPKTKLSHPGESDSFIPAVIRGKHFDNWRKIAEELGYKK